MRKALLAAAALGLLAGCEALDPMITQQKVKAYRESEFWPDRISQRAPQPGTVARTARSSRACPSPSIASSSSAAGPASRSTARRATVTSATA